MGQRSACPMEPSSLQQGKDKSYDSENGVPSRKRARKEFTGRPFCFTYSAQIGQERARTEKFLMRAIEVSLPPHTIPLTWLTSKPVWVDQWPLAREKLIQLQALIEEQFQAGHIEKSISPWNTPVFTVHKKSGKWRLLHEL